VSLEALGRNDEVLTIGTDDSKLWERCLDALRTNGIEFDEFEAGTSYSSISIKSTSELLIISQD
jgi:hypothetical protein